MLTCRVEGEVEGVIKDRGGLAEWSRVWLRAQLRTIGRLRRRNNDSGKLEGEAPVGKALQGPKRKWLYNKLNRIEKGVTGADITHFEQKYTVMCVRRYKETSTQAINRVVSKKILCQCDGGFVLLSVDRVASEICPDSLERDIL